MLIFRGKRLILSRAKLNIKMTAEQRSSALEFWLLLPRFYPIVFQRVLRKLEKIHWSLVREGFSQSELSMLLWKQIYVGDVGKVMSHIVNFDAVWWWVLLLNWVTESLNVTHEHSVIIPHRRGFPINEKWTSQNCPIRMKFESFQNAPQIHSWNCFGCPLSWHDDIEENLNSLAFHF